MEPNKIVQSDILDTIFDARNKAYGDYERRKSYNKTSTVPLAPPGGLLVLALLISLVVNSLEPAADTKFDIKDVELIKIKDEPPPVEPPPPPPPKSEPPPKVEMTKFTTPVIVKDEEVKKED